ncbi:MAG TPA: hypothetical protein VM818_01795 [Vicinamibacterales bacterium]|jgi:hypothetical protein|nr:hypothetical protein [Vicinamibacterales bacterium]
MTRALGAPHRGQTMPEVDRLAMKQDSFNFLDGYTLEKDASLVQIEVADGDRIVLHRTLNAKIAPDPDPAHQ